MLKLRRGIVAIADDPADSPWQRLTVDLDGERRPAVADVGLVGPCSFGDEVVVNVEARDLALGSGGFDVVHVNLTSGLDGEGVAGAHVMKFNYTSLQHAVLPVEGETLAAPLGRPVAAFPLHGHLAPVAWAIAQARPGTRVGYVQTAGGALPGAMSATVRELRARGLLVEHVTAGPAFGGADGEAITTAGALHDGLAERGWEVALAGPGPGILGSGSALGHGGIVALDTAHAALALGCPTVLVARMSSGDPRPRHQGLSHHTRTVLELLLAPVTLPVPAGSPGAAPAASPGADPAVSPGEDPGAGSPVSEALTAARERGHIVREAAADLAGYRASGLPARTMGRELEEDEPFFAAALAAGTTIAAMAGER